MAGTRRHAGALAVADLARVNFDLTVWQAASYPVVAVPLLVSYIALTQQRGDP